jgi:hypothetical protein
MKSSLNSLVPFFPLFCKCHFRRLDSIQILCFQDGVPKLDSSLLDWFKRPYLSIYNPSARTTQKAASLLLIRLSTDPLPSSGRPIVARIRLRGNVFTESLPSHGSIRHSMHLPYISVFLSFNFYSFQYATSILVSCFNRVFRSMCDSEHEGIMVRWNLQSPHSSRWHFDVLYFISTSLTKLVAHPFWVLLVFWFL